MTQFHKGSHVRIKSKEQLARENDVTIGEEFYSTRGLAFLPDMWDGCGRDNVLDVRDDDSDHWWRFKFDLEEGGWDADNLLWDEEWFEPIEIPFLISISDLEDLL